MKKMCLAMVICFVVVPSAFSYTIISDPNVFYSFFEKPKKIIEFTNLKDGTPYDGIPDKFRPNKYYVSEPDCLIIGTGEYDKAGGFEALAVRPGSFSNAWSFMGADPNKEGTYCEAVIWFDHGISTGSYKMMVSVTAGQSQPFVVYTNKGFIGILPDTPHEKTFIFDNFYLIFSFETEFTRVTPLSDSKELSFLAQLETNEL